MSSDHAGQKHSSVIFHQGIIRFVSCRGLVGIVALVLTLAAPSQGYAQISLGAAGGFELFAASNSPSLTGHIYTSQSMIYSNLALAANATYAGSSTSIGGSVYLDNSAQLTNGQYAATGPVGGAIIVGSLAQASADALSAANYAASWGTSTPANVLSTFAGVGNFQVNGLTSNNGLNVINFASFASIGGGGGTSTININATSSNEQFVFNFANGGTLTQTNVVLNGVSASNVFFNVTGGSFSAIGESSINGTVLNMSGGGMSLDNDYITGSVISNGFVDMSGTVLAPELPTIMMAGLAGLLVFGHAGLNRLRSRSRRVVGG